MKHDELQEIINVLPKGKTFFRYFKDRYALLLLEYAARDGMQLADLRQTRFGKLLSRPIVQPILSEAGSGAVSGWDFDAAWPAEHECYLLTLGQWGEPRKHRWEPYHHQTSRPGLNLVLQLNFSSKHDGPYAELVGDQNVRPFEYTGHPISDRGLHTLAWARLDIDLANGQALIEELQTDWVRKARRAAGFLEEDLADDPDVINGEIEFWGGSYKARGLQQYITHVLSAHVGMWDEALLSAALWFLSRELGIKDIFIHDFDSGNLLKELNWGQPPRSLYTALPKKFCFEHTADRPHLLADRRGRRLRRWIEEDRIRFWRLQL